jgi:hypothetical protein
MIRREKEEGRRKKCLCSHSVDIIQQSQSNRGDAEKSFYFNSDSPNAVEKLPVSYVLRAGLLISTELHDFLDDFKMFTFSLFYLDVESPGLPNPTPHSRRLLYVRFSDSRQTIIVRRGVPQSRIQCQRGKRALQATPTCTWYSPPSRRECMPRWFSSDNFKLPLNNI